MGRALVIGWLVFATGCHFRSTPAPIAPTLIASGSWTGWPDGSSDSSWTIAGTANGHRVSFAVDYGANLTALTTRVWGALGLPEPFANATRVVKIALHAGSVPVLDSTANATIQATDTITQYWGDFEPMFLDSIRLGTSLQPHVFLPAPLSSTNYSIEALIGRDMLSQFDVEMNGPANTIRLYQRFQIDSTTRLPRWLPKGVAKADCMRVPIIGPRPIPPLEPADTAGSSDAGKQQIFDELVAGQRLLGQTELRFPVLVDGHPIDATFDSGTAGAIINWVEARALGLTPENPRVRRDPTDSAWASVAKDVSIEMNHQSLRVPEVAITDLKFSGDSAYLTKPLMLLGLAQFRDRVLFLSHSTGSVCVGPSE